MTRRSSTKPPVESSFIPAAGGLLDWRDAQHYDRWQTRSCALCEKPTPLHSRAGEPAHKACAEDWIAANPIEARLDRFASDARPKQRRDDHHA
ncbi:hypothetical protein [Streptomyces sp. NPDC049916]|uniref:hypothetical protein n=1 Tax=Streptomyces sp. NPDC049916 TaxID=3155156 RepID=UPI0034413CD4